MSKKKELALGYGASAHLAYWEAQDFKDTANAAYKKELYKPVIVNFAFACELYMKSLLMLQRKSKDVVVGHELNNLFLDLDNPIRERIVRETKIKKWDEFMSDSSNAFEAWRYYYEKDKSMVGHISELSDLANTLDNICTEIFSVKEK